MEPVNAGDDGVISVAAGGDVELATGISGDEEVVCAGVKDLDANMRGLGS